MNDLGPHVRTLFDRVSSHLAARDVDFQYHLNPVATSDDIAEAERKLALDLPKSYVDLITSFADGLALSWSAHEDGPMGAFAISSVLEAVESLLDMRTWRFYSDEAAEEYGFPYTDDSELALVTNRQMRNWLPLHSEPNGDYLSLDLNPDGHGSLIFDQHDWLDGGTGENGFFMARSLPEFLQSWAGVCFAMPAHLWWKLVLTDNGVDWNSPEFDDQYRI